MILLFIDQMGNNFLSLVFLKRKSHERKKEL